MSGHKVSVIVPATGSAPSLRACVESVLACAYDDTEVFVVDDGLSQAARSSLEAFGARITVLASGGGGPSCARNLAASRSTSEYLAFTDSDCVVDPRWLSMLLDGFRLRPDAVSVGGIQEPARDSSLFEREVFAFMRKAGFVADYARCPVPEAGLLEVDHNASCNVMYRRDVFLNEGGFREGLWPGEDVDLDYRLREHKHVIVCNRLAIVYHDKPRTMSRFRGMMFSYGRAQGELVRMHGRIFRKMQIVPLIMMLLCSIVFVRPVFGILLLAALAATFAAYLGSGALFVLGLNALVCWNAGFFVGIVRGPVPEAAA